MAGWPGRGHGWRLGWLLLLGWFLAAGPLRAATINGQEYASLDQVGGWLGMKPRVIETGKQVRLESRWTRIDFLLHQRVITLNGVRVHLGWPVAAQGNRLLVSKLDYERTLQPLLTPHVFTTVPQLKRIVIDPGHGGKDTGATNERLKLAEKALVLDVSRRLQKLLQAQGYVVSLTREDDRFIPLEERAAIANRAKADLFISVHFNASTVASVRGIETFVFTPQGAPSTGRDSLTASDRRAYPANRQDVWNILVGMYVQKSMLEATQGHDRGLKRARFAVLRDLQMPGILVEGGFVSHEGEGRSIGSAAYRQKLAQSIADGVRTYQRTLNRLRQKDS